MKLTKIAVALATVLSVGTAYAANNEFFHFADDGMNEVEADYKTMLFGSDDYENNKVSMLGLSYERGFAGNMAFDVHLDNNLEAEANKRTMGYGIGVAGTVEAFYWGLMVDTGDEDDAKTVASVRLGYAITPEFSADFLYENTDADDKPMTIGLGYEHELGSVPAMWTLRYMMAGSDVSKVTVGNRTRFAMGPGELLVDADLIVSQTTAPLGVKKTWKGNELDLTLGYRMPF